MKQQQSHLYSGVFRKNMVYSRRAVRIDRLRLSGEVLFSTQAGSKEGIYPKFSAHEGRYLIVPFSLADEI